MLFWKFRKTILKKLSPPLIFQVSVLWKLYHLHIYKSRKEDIVEFFFSKMQTYKVQPSILGVFIIQEKYWEYVCYKVSFYRSGYYKFCTEQKVFGNSQEDLQVQLERAPPCMFYWKVSKIFRSSYSVRKLMDRCFLKFKKTLLEQQCAPPDGWIGNRWVINDCSKVMVICHITANQIKNTEVYWA